MTDLDEIIADLREREEFPERGGDLSFDAPWQARAFATVVTLYRQGFFEWNEFQARLIEAIESADTADDEDIEDVYYRHWLEAAEQLLYDKGVLRGDVLDRRIGEFESGERDASEFVVGVDHAHTHTHNHDH
ncbi:nitrile hydratase accessory protein [Halocatena halophila]|uniref:nitrile hydratase accessory protein n=1 Tax=Halocatena halophila TaxID=2814576 RepID=UPI002ED5118A